MSELDKEIKEIEKAEADLAKKKQALLDEAKKLKAKKAELDALVKKSGFGSPRKLVDALIANYGLRMGVAKPGRPAGGRRKRTKITSELRDQVKTEIHSLGSVNAAAKKMGISYLVVAKINKGAYDKLK